MRIWILILAILSCPMALGAGSGSPSDSQDDYDRLDGTGLSGKKVQVIEWEGNLEIHVYPSGSLRGLSLKLDKRNQSKPVMVIGYRFGDDRKQVLIRRAILGIDIQESFKVYKDPSEPEFDKIIISNNTLSENVVAFKLDPPPTQLYPDGHPLNNAPAVADTKPSVKAKTKRLPAAEDEEEHPVDEAGTIKPFFMQKGE